MYGASAGNHDFALAFTRAVNLQREAERNNRGEALPDRYKLTGGDRMVCDRVNECEGWKEHYVECVYCSHFIFCPWCGKRLDWDRWERLGGKWLRDAEGTDQLHCHRVDSAHPDRPEFLGGEND